MGEYNHIWDDRIAEFVGGREGWTEKLSYATVQGFDHKTQVRYGRDDSVHPRQARILLAFDRPLRYPVPQEVIEDYERKRAIVEAHDGRMRRLPHELGEPTPKFTEEDLDVIRQEMRQRIPGHIVVDSWNGVGCRSVSFVLIPCTHNDMNGDPGDWCPDCGAVWKVDIAGGFTEPTWETDELA